MEREKQLSGGWVGDYSMFGGLLAVTGEHVHTSLAEAWSVETGEPAAVSIRPAIGPPYPAIAGVPGLWAWTSTEGSGIQHDGVRIELEARGTVVAVTTMSERALVAIGGGGDQPGWVELFDARGEHQLTVKVARKPIKRLFFSHSGRLLATSDGTKARLYALETSNRGRLCASKPVQHAIEGEVAIMGEELIVARGQRVDCLRGGEVLWSTDVGELGHVAALTAGPDWVLCLQSFGFTVLGPDGRVRRTLLDELGKRERELEVALLLGRASRAPEVSQRPWASRMEPPHPVRVRRVEPSPIERRVVWVELDRMTQRMRVDDLTVVSRRAVPPMGDNVCWLRDDLVFWMCPSHGPSIWDLEANRLAARLPCPAGSLTTRIAATRAHDGELVHAHLERSPSGHGYVAIRHDPVEPSDERRLALRGRMPSLLAALERHTVVLVQSIKGRQGSISVFENDSGDLVLEQPLGGEQGWSDEYYDERVIDTHVARFYGAKKVLEVDTAAAVVRTVVEWPTGYMGPLSAIAHSGREWLRYSFPAQRCVLERLDERTGQITTEWDMPGPSDHPPGPGPHWACFTPDDRHVITAEGAELIARASADGRIVGSAALGAVAGPRTRVLCGTRWWLLIDRHGRWWRMPALEGTDVASRAT